jgi:uncharacterized protein YyaL (SSP411 family)
VVQETIGYVLRDLLSPEGAFYSAEDADSLDESGHSHEGHFYVFTPDQVRRIIPTHLMQKALDWYEITDTGNFEGKSIPCRLEHRGALERDDDIETIRVHIRHLRTKLEPDPRKPRFIKTVYGAGYCLELPSGNHLTDCIALMAEFRAQQQQRELSAQVQ